ncbi:hypothetical protein LQK89_06035 [Curtobacterium sp. C1]|uniref:hypothetical protein n=1 Tax=Curtobacterium sp. C1 TaxID=2898151 RepID=UPI001E2FF85A|nr:hypothetical protein [Curtobacterium sp. C1]UFU15249.1 hypothetical protein LQK89_06035 [Curtobacterium sp. C1]
MSYPSWSYFPRNARPEPWAEALCAAVGAQRTALDTLQPLPTGATRPSSDGVLEVLRPSMERLGYLVEAGKTRSQRIERPVLFGENGRAEVTYEIDAFHDGLGIAVEVEAGRGAMSNAAYRDIIRTSLLLDADYFVLMMPISYRYQSAGRTSTTDAYAKTREQLSAIYASQRLRLPFRAVLLIGY